MDVGRNEPCPCGSGKKYKRCCGIEKPDELADAAGVLRAAQTSAETRIWAAVHDELGDEGLDDAWAEFNAAGVGLDPERDERDLFRSWALYDWQPWEPFDIDDEGNRITRPTPALMTLLERAKEFSDSEFLFLMAVGGTPLSFHEVVAAEPGRTVTLRDLMVGGELTVYERLGSADIQPGQILFARAVAFESVGLLIGTGQFVIPPTYHDSIRRVRKELKPRLRRFTVERLREAGPDLLAGYFAIREQLLHPQLPELRNTDDDPMEFHTLTYTVESLEAAVRALAPLAMEVGADELLAEAKRPRPGGVQRVEFPWTRPGNAMHGGMQNTVLAEFKFSGTTLTVSVNSSKRAKQAKAEITKRLGDEATFVREERQKLAEVLAKASTEPESRRDRASRLRNEELQARPEVQAVLARVNAEHYETWPDIPLPALKGKTPRAAMRTAAGRERVEALIADFERSQDGGRTMAPHYDFNQLRASLGLPKRGEHEREV